MKLSKKDHERIVNEQIRKDILGGSDAAAAIGLSKWKTPLQLAQEKLGLVELFQGNRFTEAGKRLEDVIARWYADETGSKVARVNRTLKLDGYPFIVAHVDRRVVGKRKVLECKSADKWTIANWESRGVRMCLMSTSSRYSTICCSKSILTMQILQPSSVVMTSGSTILPPMLSSRT